MSKEILVVGSESVSGLEEILEIISNPSPMMEDVVNSQNYVSEMIQACMDEAHAKFGLSGELMVKLLHSFSYDDEVKAAFHARIMELAGELESSRPDFDQRALIFFVKNRKDESVITYGGTVTVKEDMVIQARDNMLDILLNDYDTERVCYADISHKLRQVTIVEDVMDLSQPVRPDNQETFEYSAYSDHPAISLQSIASIVEKTLGVK